MKTINKQWTYTGVVLIASLVVGSLAGIVSSIATNRSLDNYMQVMSDDEIILSLSQVKPDPVPGTYEEALSSVYDSYDSLVYVYLNSDVSKLESEWMYQKEALGVGVVVTSDGWILFEAQTLDGLDIADINLLINEEWYQPVEIVEDIRSNAVLVHVDASGFDAITFGSSELTRSGEMVFIVKNDSALFVSSLVDSQYYVQSMSVKAEDRAAFWQIFDDVDESLPIFDSSGHLVGFTSGGVDALPFYHVEQFIESVLSDGEPQYAAMGAYTLDIERALNADTDLLGTDHGFILVRPDIYTRALVSGSPASDAGLREHDVIVSIDAVDVSSQYTLTKALSQYSINEEITVGVMREGEYLEFILTLEDYNLLY